MKELDRPTPPKSRQKPPKPAAKGGATESGRVAGQLGGLYVRGRAKPGAQKSKGKAKGPEHD